MPDWLVTGGNGFLGRHLLAALDERRPAGTEIACLGRRPPSHPSQFYRADLDSPREVEDAIRAANPSVIFHLAGRTPPAPSDVLHQANTLATVHLLEVLRTIARPVRVVLAGSAAELGPVEVEDLPVSESFPCRPVDSYGLSKWLATCAVLASRPPLEVVVGRVFNPIGPGLPASQAFGRFAALLADPAPDTLRITVGDLDARRDFIDARDVARAFVALAERGRPGLVYHVGTGESRRVGDGLDRLIRLSGRDVRVEPDPRFVRARGPSDSRADVRRIAGHTGWSAQIPWEQSLADLWRASRLPLTPPAPLV